MKQKRHWGLNGWNRHWVFWQQSVAWGSSCNLSFVELFRFCFCFFLSNWSTTLKRKVFSREFYAMCSIKPLWYNYGVHIIALSFWSGMIMGAAASTVYYNLKLRHPSLDMPIIDYDLALLVQPMLMLGISIGVAFNVVFADWMVTVLLIILFVGR